jgi:hypothetical protein
MILYHGGQSWSGPAEIREHRKGHAEHGPGVYLTTSWQTAKKYSKGGGSVYRVEVDPPKFWSDKASIPVDSISEFATEALGKGKKSKTFMEAVNKVAARTGESIPAWALIAISVNNDLSVGKPGVLLAKFLSELGIGASRVSMGSEDYVVVHDPSLIRSVSRLRAEEVSSGGFEFDLPRVGSMAVKLAFLYRLQQRLGSRACNPTSVSHAWISDTGEAHLIPDRVTHSEWARTYLEGNQIYESQRYGSSRYLTDSLGWIRVSNAYNMETGPRGASDRAMEAAVELLIECVASERDKLERLVAFEVGSKALYLPVSDFVERYGTRKQSDSLYERLLSRM